MNNNSNNNNSNNNNNHNKKNNNKKTSHRKKPIFHIAFMFSQNIEQRLNTQIWIRIIPA